MNRQNIIKLALLALSVVALVYIVSSYSKSNSVVDQFVDMDGQDTEEVSDVQNDSENFGTEFEEFTGNSEVQASEALGNNEVYQNVESGSSQNQHPADCFPKDQLTPGELLPGDANSKWAQSVPAGQGELGDQNFLTAGHHVGVNTVGQSLRNANRQIRSEPPNPQVKVSPWLQSTIEADTNRKPLEIGGCE
tara:strand:- start:6621 stop:7196 length:576 start_codon:yes stop_codon:yes gene_type:complete